MIMPILFLFSGEANILYIWLHQKDKDLDPKGNKISIIIKIF